MSGLVYVLLSLSLRHQTLHIYRWKFVFTFSLVFVASPYAGHSIEIIVVILTGPADEEVFFLIDQIPARIFTLFEIWNQLDRIGRTGFLAHATVNAARKVDSEELRITALVSLWIVRSLKRDAIDGTGCRAEVTSHTPLFSVRISGEDDASTPTWWQIGLLFRILNRHRLREGPFKDDP